MAAGGNLKHPKIVNWHQNMNSVRKRRMDPATVKVSTDYTDLASEEEQMDQAGRHRP